MRRTLTSKDPEFASRFLVKERLHQVVGDREDGWGCGVIKIKYKQLNLRNKTTPVTDFLKLDLRWSYFRGQFLGKILSLETNLSSLITMATMSFACLRSLIGLRFSEKRRP